MDFRDVLLEISRKTTIEELVWKKMKPFLIKIAGDRHSKGCHVRFLGVGNTFINKMREVIRADGIPIFLYPTENDDSCKIGIIYWESVCCGRFPESYRYTDVSDILLEVTLTHGKSITIEDVKLNFEQRNKDYSYIS